MYEFVTDAYIVKKAKYQKPGANWTRYEIIAYDPTKQELYTGSAGYMLNYIGNSKDNGKTPLKFYVNGKKIIDYTSHI